MRNAEVVGPIPFLAGELPGSGSDSPRKAVYERVKPMPPPPPPKPQPHLGGKKGTKAAKLAEAAAAKAGGMEAEAEVFALESCVLQLPMSMNMSMCCARAKDSRSRPRG